ncbi:hypothetical protein E2C01_008319 [Portunus trituberculatus]|uniref:Uncharacterized protein n=1 Tax=Portunus trituberculatus TaxID=210409 RepID=A0A5B7D2H7_PORTR|nr:hypothetical protein [Portunus trituberculatus]
MQSCRSADLSSARPACYFCTSQALLFTPEGNFLHFRCRHRSNKKGTQGRLKHDLSPWRDRAIHTSDTTPSRFFLCNTDGNMQVRYECHSR